MRGWAPLRRNGTRPRFCLRFRRLTTTRDKDDRMSMPYGQAESAVAPGGYVDPHGAAGHRWWDGARWTEHTQPQTASAPAPWTSSTVAPAFAQPGQVYPG